MNRNLFDVLRDGFQCLTIPKSGRYRFEVIGASRCEGRGFTSEGQIRISPKIQLKRTVRFVR